MKDLNGFDLSGLFNNKHNKGTIVTVNEGGKSFNFDKCSNHGKTKKAPMRKRKK